MAEYDIMGNATGFTDPPAEVTVAEAAPAPAAATPLKTNFNSVAAAVVYGMAGTLDVDWSLNVDLDATIKASSIETNLAAISVGFKGTEAESAVNSFKDIILAHPDLKESAEAMLKDEGSNVMSGMEQLLTGDGAIDLEEFKKMMEDPTKRKLVADMFKAVATDEHGMDDAVQFTRLAMDAVKNPTDTTKGQAFLQFAKDLGIDTGAVEQAGMMDMLKEFWTNPGKAVAGFVDSLGLPPEWRDMITGLMTGMAELGKGILNDYAYGDGKSRPGLFEVFDNAGIQLGDYGRKVFADNGITPTPSAPAP